jgi:hypothetical protein
MTRHDPENITHYYASSLRGVDVRSDLVWCGSDPELADYDNPKGEIWRVRYYVEIITSACPYEGVRFRHHHAFEDQAAAERLADRVLKAVLDDRLPNPKHWSFSGHLYGSDAYQRLGGEQDLVSWEADRPW